MYRTVGYMHWDAYRIDLSYGDAHPYIVSYNFAINMIDQSIILFPYVEEMSSNQSKL